MLANWSGSNALRRLPLAALPRTKRVPPGQLRRSTTPTDAVPRVARRVYALPSVSPLNPHSPSIPLNMVVRENGGYRHHLMIRLPSTDRAWSIDELPTPYVNLHPMTGRAA